MTIYTMRPKYRPFFDPQQMQANFERSTRHGLEEIDFMKNAQYVGKTAIIVAPGSSIYKPGENGQSPLDKLNEGSDGTIIIAASGHRLVNPVDGNGASNERRLLRNVDFVIANTPISDFTREFNPPLENAKYCLASHCPAGGNYDLKANPDVFKYLIDGGYGDNTHLFHADTGLIDLGNRRAIGTGSGAGSASFPFAAAFGHTKIITYGWDSSLNYGPDISDLPAYVASLTDPVNQVAIRIDGKIYTTHAAFWAQTEEAIEFLENHPEITLEVRGESLNALIFNTASGKPRRDYEVVKGLDLPPPTPQGMG